MFRYLRHHARGRLSLGVSFWINFIALSVLILLAGGAVRDAASTDAHVVFAVALLWFVVFHLVVYGWQVCGAWRAAEQAMLDYRPALWVRGAQSAILLSVFIVFSQALEVVHLGYNRNVEPESRSGVPSYVLHVSGDGRVVYLDGMIDFGLTGALETLLQAHPGVRVITLDSGGGLVAEARGVARVIERHRLDTHVESRCHSACTLAYLGGETRSLGPRARLGFHSYRLRSPYLPMFMDPEAEMRRDRSVLAGRGVVPGFLDRVSTTPPSEMWFPSLQAMMDSGVAHGIRVSDHGPGLAVPARLHPPGGQASR